MPVRIIGMIGVAPPSGEATVHIIKGGISPPYLKSYAQAHDKAGFDLALVGYTASSAEGFLVAQYAAHHTERLGFLIAHRPGFVAPTLAARKIATFDHLTEGRIALHIITGASDAEQEGDGDFAPKDERYRRAAEYLRGDEARLVERAALRLRGRVLQGARRQVRRASAPEAASAAVLRRRVGRRAGDGRQALRRVRDVRRAAGRRRRSASPSSAPAPPPFGRTPTFNMSFRPILGATEGAAWDAHGSILARSRSPATDGLRRRQEAARPVGAAAARLRRARRDARRAAVDADRRGDRRAWATPPAWSARPSRSPGRCSNTTSSASTRS